VIAHLVETGVEGLDQVLLPGVQGLQFPRRRGRIATVILRHMPFSGGHPREEALHFDGIGDQLAVEVPRVPIEQHTAHVEDHDRRAFRSGFGGHLEGFSGAIFRPVPGTFLVGVRGLVW
jgi:hypothetical protein